MTAAIGVMVLGDGDLLPQKQNRVAGWGHFGLSYPLTDAWTLKGQLDYHGQLIDASVDQLGGAALQGTFGVTLAGDAAVLVRSRDGRGPDGGQHVGRDGAAADRHEILTGRTTAS